MSEVAKRVGLPITSCWRRIQKLEEEGVILGRIVVIDAEQVNANATVFVSVRTSSRFIEWLNRFSELVSSLPEVMKFYRMSDDIDYLWHVVVPNIAAYDVL